MALIPLNQYEYRKDATGRNRYFRLFCCPKCAKERFLTKNQGRRYKSCGCREGKHHVVDQFESIIIAALDWPITQCYKWPFGTSKGYAHYGLVNISRYICECKHGAAPNSKSEARHLCGRGNQACINGNHIIWGSRLDNEKDKGQYLKITGEFAR